MVDFGGCPIEGDDVESMVGSVENNVLSHDSETNKAEISAGRIVSIVLLSRLDDGGVEWGNYLFVTYVGADMIVVWERSMICEYIRWCGCRWEECAVVPWGVVVMMQSLQRIKLF